MFSPTSSGRDETDTAVARTSRAGAPGAPRLPQDPHKTVQIHSITAKNAASSRVTAGPRAARPAKFL